MVKFNWLDLIVMLVAIRGLYTGQRRGILGEIAFILGCIASFSAAYYFAPTFSQGLSSKISLIETTAYRFCFWSLAFSGIIGALILGKIFQKLSRMIFGSGFNKCVGAILGAVRALGFGGILILCIFTVYPNLQLHVDDSALGGYVVEGTEISSTWMQELVGLETVLKDEDMDENVEESEASTEEIEEEENIDISEIPWS